MARIEGRRDDLLVEVSVDPHQIEPEIKRLDEKPFSREEHSGFRVKIEKQIFRQRIRGEGRIPRFVFSIGYTTT